MSLSPNKIILANAATNTAGAYFEPFAVIATNTSNVGTVVPVGSVSYTHLTLPTKRIV